MAHNIKLPPGPRRVSHIVNLSGGKDSQACAHIAVLMGKPFRLVMADTGNEHPFTLEHAHYIAEFVGVPLEIARADFTARLAAKRDFVVAEWSKRGVPQDRIDRALAALRPTGNPFVDLCLWKGRFPSRRAQFCTEFLKADAVEQSVIAPAMTAGPVIQWLGVRRDESLNRRAALMFQKHRRPDGLMLFFRPIVHWSADNVFSFIRAQGAKPNPLYLHGMRRVGCFPCINASKGELRQIGRRFPEAVEKLLEWESAVAEASKRGAATFFAPNVTPEGAAIAKSIKRIADPAARSAASATAPWPTADKVFEWATTSRGGRQFQLPIDADEGLSCSSQYGLCE